MNSLNPITLTGDKPREDNSCYYYATASIIRKVALDAKYLQDWAILGLSSYSHVILSTVLVVHKHIADVPLTVRLPNDDVLSASLNLMV